MPSTKKREMTGFEPYYKRILDEVKRCDPDTGLVIRTTYTAIAKTIGLHEWAKSEDYHIILEIFDTADARGVKLGVYLKEKLCSAHLSLDEVKMNAKAERMVADGARVVEI